MLSKLGFLIFVGVMYAEDEPNIFPSDYRKDVPPALAMAQSEKSAINATSVSIRLMTLYISGVSIKTMDFDAEIVHVITWMEPRLILEEVNKHAASGEWELPRPLIRRLWHPWLLYENCKDCQGLVIDPIVQRTYIGVMNNTPVISMIRRESVTFACRFDLTYYPFDTQSCFIQVEMSPFPFNKYVDIHPRKFPNEGREAIVPPEYQLLSHTVTKCVSGSVLVLDRAAFAKFEGKNHCLRYTFWMRRSVFQHLLLIYVPSFLIVLLSWISFCINVDKAPARIALGLTSLLTLVTQLTGIQSHLPPTGGVKSIDIWMFTCIYMVFSSLLVFALANICRNRKLDSNVVFPDNVIPNSARLWKKCTRCQKCLRHVLRCCCFPSYCSTLTSSFIWNPSTIDHLAAQCFFFMFAIFNIFYWSFNLMRYSSMFSDEQKDSFD